MSNYTNEQKKRLRDRIVAAQEASGLSANKFAVERLGFSNGSKFSHIRKNWDKAGMVGNDTWEAVEKYLTASEEYKGVPTENLKKVWKSCERAYALKKAIAVVGEGGLGKTFALEAYKRHIEAQQRFKVVYFDVSMIRTNKQFVAGLMHSLDCHKAGTISTQIALMREYVRKQDMLILLDEVSSLQGHNITIIKDVMTAFKDLCGLVLAGTPYFYNNLNRGASRDRHLFSETKDRIFMLPERLTKPTAKEAEAVFVANGITGEALNIVMGQNKKLLSHSWVGKQTYRGIRDCIDMLRMAEMPEIDYNNIQL